MSADQPLDRGATEWLAKLPVPKAEGQANGFDGPAWLADWFEAHACNKAEAVFLGLDEFMEAAPRTLSDLEQHIMLQGLIMLEAWGSTMLTYGADGRRAINAPLLAARVRAWGAGQAFCELVGPRPGEGAVGAFSFGRCRGVIEGTLGALGVPVEMVAPAWWKRRVGIPPGADKKDVARSEAIRRWPGMADRFARKKDDGRAEAALIAVAGMTREGRS